MAEIPPSQKNYKDPNFIKYAVENWIGSNEYKEMKTGDEYYKGKQDILTRQQVGFDRGAGSPTVLDVERTVGEYTSSCGDVGCAAGPDNLPDNRIVNNRYATLVDQKVNYLLGNPVDFSSENPDYAKTIKETLGPHFNRTLRNIGTDSLNCHIGWMFLWIDEHKKLRFRKLNPIECIPFWTDDEKTELECFIRVYEVEIVTPSVASSAPNKKTERRVEVYLPDEVDYYVFDGTSLKPAKGGGAYIERIGADGKPVLELNWGRIPIIGFRYNPSEIPLIRRVKVLQDALNEIMSFFMNNMQEDARSTIFILKNYGGQDGAEFKRQLMRIGVLNIATGDGADGGVETLQVEVNAENYDLLISTLQRAITENGRGYDAKDANSGGDPNEMNLKSMYIDIDLDANMMETEYQASFEDLFYFVNMYLEFSNKGKFKEQSIEVIFNRDTIVDESSMVEMISKLTGLVSNQTLREQVPFIRDAEKEEARVQAEKEAQRQEDEMFAAAMSLSNPNEEE